MKNQVFKDGKGELRSNNYQVVIPPSIYPTGARYEPANDKPITHIKETDLLKLLKENDLLKDETPAQPVQTNIDDNIDVEPSPIESNKTFEDFKRLKDKNRKLNALFRGDSSEYQSRSEGDLGFMSSLVIHGFSKEICFEIFNKSGRQKWHEKPLSYKNLLHDTAVEGVKRWVTTLYNRIKGISLSSNPSDYFTIVDNNDLMWSNLKDEMVLRFQNGEVFNLLLNSRSVFEGKILNKLNDHKIDVTIAFSYQYEDDEGNKKTGLAFFDNKEAMKFRRPESTFSFPFYTYMYFCGKKRYFVLSDKELETVPYVIKGVEVKVLDSVAVGDNAKFPTNTSVILPVSIEPIKPVFNNAEEMFEKIKSYGLDHDKFFNWLLFHSGFKKTARQPHEVELLLGASLFSSLRGFSGYPLSLLLFGEQGVHKSGAIESIHTKIEEAQDIVEGSGSTIKSIIPSFKNTLAEPGAYLRAYRVCFCDEFLRLLMRSPIEERGVLLTSLNPLLEHKQREMATGNSRLSAKATANFVAVTNPVYGTHTIVDLIQNFSESDSFFSRVLVYYYNKDFEQKARREENIEENHFQMDNQIFLGMVDFLRGIESKFDAKRVREIHASFVDLLPDKIRDMYEGRYKHHILCVMDGLVKQRCIYENDATFTATDEDYNQLKKLWRSMIINWATLDLSSIGSDRAINYLNREELFIYEVIKRQGSVWDYQIKKECEEYNIIDFENHLSRLISFKLIKKNDRKYELPNVVFTSEEGSRNARLF